MLKNVNKRNIGIIIGFLIIFTGICIIGSTYYNTKKNEVFDDMNELYYEQVLNMDASVEELSDTKSTIPSKGETTTTIKVPDYDYSKYYVGYIKIPNINLQHGFTAKDSKYNNVNRNIYVLPSSDYPDVDNGNLILAAHSGTSSISYFKNLYKLVIGNDIYINYNDIDYHYQIKKIYTDTKDGDVRITRNKSKKTLTLITCTKGDQTTQTIYICELV